jgi:hypothetical protein
MLACQPWLDSQETTLYQGYVVAIVAELAEAAEDEFQAAEDLRPEAQLTFAKVISHGLSLFTRRRVRDRLG